MLILTASNSLKAGDLSYTLICVNDMMNTRPDIEYIGKIVRKTCHDFVSKKSPPTNNDLLNIACVYFKLAFLLEESGKTPTTDLISGQSLLNRIDFTQELKEQIQEYTPNPFESSDEIPIQLSLALLHQNIGTQDKNTDTLEKANKFLTNIESFTKNEFLNFIQGTKTDIHQQIFTILNPNQAEVPPTRTCLPNLRILRFLGAL